MAGRQETGDRVVTCSAPVNIAVIKYWGKRDENLILPLNSSLSVTLNQNELRATTTVALSRRFTKDRIWINGREESIGNPRLQKCLKEVRRLSREQHRERGQQQEEEEEEGCVHICSENNFPTAAGLASSAAGYACLVYCLSKLFDVQGDISKIARQGSGSACRSVHGGFVKWERGECEDGGDSVAVQVATATHWQDLEVLVLVVSGERKPVSSTTGMQTSTLTSQLLKYRAERIVPERTREMEEAISGRDFQTFGKLTMQESNQFHAVCLDTYPPILYLNDTSRWIIQLITQYNQLKGHIKAAYTFDAGPNAVLYALSPDVPQLLTLIHHYLPPSEGTESPYLRGISVGRTIEALDTSLKDSLQFEPVVPGALQYIIHTKVGEGPQVLSPEESLLGHDGLPNATRS